ncbi:hypothetical protein PENSPDRAFT_618889 [Peniophora sp. CONT]|nr:hypothetical protein PENSPDRAFT_618889 [Peniophora sp. CONT]
MSSGDSHRNVSGPSSDKRRRQNACDMCRKRKIRCDGKDERTGKCSNCTTRNWECEFNNFTAKGSHTGYTEALEIKVARLESLIKRLLPGQDFTREIGYKLTRDNWMMPGVCGTSTPNDSVAYASPNTGTMPTSAGAISNPFSVLGPDQAPPMTPPPQDGHSSDEEDSLTTKLQQLPALTSTKPRDMASFLGKSSAVGLFKTAVALCSQLAPQVNAGTLFGKAQRRPDWMDGLWNDNGQVHYNFPDQDLLDELVDLYFLHIHTFAPVLHRPTFEADRRSGLHLRDRTFGGLVLLVCALAARFSHDHRVLVQNEPAWNSVGWKWFSQVRLYDNARILKPTSHLHGLQTICLGAMYSVNVSHVYAWIHAGWGIRLALDIGAHKRRAYGATPTVEDELYKRTFWMLVYIDRTLSGMTGRPCSIQEEDFDLELPLCCDDEYLTPGNPVQVAKQPDDKPSYVIFFVWMIKLSQIHGLALRTLYASAKARTHYNFQGQDWNTRTTAHLDSLLNNWENSVPDHLRWDSNRANDLFFCQSAHLYVQYHEIRIMVHRQSLVGLQPTPMLSSALTICMNSARSLVRLMCALLRRSPERTGLVRWDAIHTGMALLVGLGLARLHGITLDRQLTLADIDTVIAILRLQEDHWRCANRFADTLEIFKAIDGGGDVEPVNQRKRRHEEDDIVPERPEPQFAPVGLPQPSFALAQDASLRAELNAPSIFISASSSNEAVDNPSSSPNASIPQPAGAVLGNIDFGALFGFGNANMENTGPPPGDVDSNMFSSEDWMGMPFDFGMDEWQWLTPTPEETGHKE